ncbi:hypothetical protein C0J52_24194 [Blattella germanica]|nr:hypothetical protein C0J52_24194 [Blattella germanica]
MEGDNSVRKLTLLKPEGSRRVGRPKLRWMGGIEEDLRKLGTRAWRRRALDRDDWRKVLAAARAQKGLLSHDGDDDDDDITICREVGSG